MAEESVEGDAVVGEGRPAKAGRVTDVAPETALQAMRLEVRIVDHRHDLLASIASVQQRRGVGDAKGVEGGGGGLTVGLRCVHPEQAAGLLASPAPLQTALDSLQGRRLRRGRWAGDGKGQQPPCGREAPGGRLGESDRDHCQNGGCTYVQRLRQGEDAEPGQGRERDVSVGADGDEQRSKRYAEPNHNGSKST